MVDNVEERFSLVNRLKSLSLCFSMPIGKEAADEIERLQGRVEDLELALLDVCSYHGKGVWEVGYTEGVDIGPYVGEVLQEYETDRGA